MQAWTVEGAGVPLATSQLGDGPGAPLVVVHGMASDRLAWASPAERVVAAGRRVVLYDRRGYGESGAPEPYVGTTVEEQAEDAAAVLRACCEEPAVVVGDGFGALVALDLVRRHRSLVQAVALGHPPLFSLVPEADLLLSRERLELEASLRDHGPEQAVARWLGPGTDPALRERAKASARAFFADWAGQATWPATRRELRTLDTPAVIVTHELAPDHLKTAADKLAALLPAATRDRSGDLLGTALQL